jgi:hypothetical protein
MRRNDRQRALQIAAIDFAGPLAEYSARIRRSVGTAAVSLASRNDKQSAFKLFCFANAIVGEARYRFDTGDVDLSSNDLHHLQPAWAQWKLDSYALAKATLNAPGAIACARSIEATMTARLRYGGEVKIDGSEICAAPRLGFQLSRSQSSRSFTRSDDRRARTSALYSRSCHFFQPW